jgi:hypothetical protein
MKLLLLSKSNQINEMCSMKTAKNNHLNEINFIIRLPGVALPCFVSPNACFFFLSGIITQRSFHIVLFSLARSLASIFLFSPQLSLLLSSLPLASRKHI